MQQAFITSYMRSTELPPEDITENQAGSNPLGEIFRSNFQSDKERGI